MDSLVGRLHIQYTVMLCNVNLPAFHVSFFFLFFFLFRPPVFCSSSPGKPFPQNAITAMGLLHWHDLQLGDMGTMGTGIHWITELDMRSRLVAPQLRKVVSFRDTLYTMAKA